MRGLLLVLLILLALLQYKLWLGEGGFTDVKRLEQKVAEQVQENAMLHQRNLELEAEVADLREGVEAIEERARSELGMIKEEEEFFLVVPDDGQNSGQNSGQNNGQNDVQGKGPKDGQNDSPTDSPNADPNENLKPDEEN